MKVAFWKTQKPLSADQSDQQEAAVRLREQHAARLSLRGVGVKHEVDIALAMESQVVDYRRRASAR